MNAIFDFPSPTLLPKVRSEALRKACAEMPCNLRISSFVPGHSCSGRVTVVGCHPDSPGKGQSTKTSDLFLIAGCKHCHDLLDRVDPRWEFIADNYPGALENRIRQGGYETLAMFLMMGLIEVKGAEII